MNTYIARIIQLLVTNNGEITFAFLMDQLHISKRMIDYYLKQFDDWRVLMRFPEIKVEEDSIRLICDNYDSFFSDFITRYDIDDYYLSATERQDCIVLLIGLSSIKIKIEYLIDRFNVSKNTITNDLIIIKEALSKYDVLIESKGKNGYSLTGNEHDIRYILMQCYHFYDNAFFHKYKRELVLTELSTYGITTTDLLRNIHTILMNAEKEDNGNYIFLALHDLVETIVLDITRMQKVKIYCDESIPNNSKEAMQFIVSELNKLGISFDSSEIYYLYLIVQSAKVSSYNPKDFSEEVINLTDDIISYFKSISQLNIFEQSEIYNMFLIHVKSMYFRTKHKIKITNFRDATGNCLYGFYCIAKKVLEKVCVKYDLTYDDDEVKFLSYYFASLEYANEPVTNYMGNIVIVCVSGLGSSMYLKTQCLKLFDNSFTISISNLKSLPSVIDDETKLIISTVRIDEKQRKGIPLKRVHPVLTDKERQDLSEWYFMNRFSFNKEAEVIRDVMDIIKQCAVIKDQSKLFHDLNHYFNPINDVKLLQLEDIFTESSIVNLTDINSLEDFIYRSGQPLLDNGDLHQSYLDNVIKVLNQHGPYCECFEGILVAHAIPENDVLKPCLSLGICKEGFTVSKWNNKVIKAIFVLGVTDTESHGNAFSELINNLTRDNLYQDINQFTDSKVLYKKIINTNNRD